MSNPNIRSVILNKDKFDYIEEVFDIENSRFNSRQVTFTEKKIGNLGYFYSLDNFGDHRYKREDNELDEKPFNFRDLFLQLTDSIINKHRIYLKQNKRDQIILARSTCRYLGLGKHGESGNDFIKSVNGTSSFYEFTKANDIIKPKVDELVYSAADVTSSRDEVPDSKAFSNVTKVQIDSDKLFPVFYEQFTLTILFQDMRNTKALTKDLKLEVNMPVNKYIKYTPYNKDSFCIFHCLYQKLHNYTDKTRLVCYEDLEYMEKFSVWFSDNNLIQYYNDDEEFLFHSLPDIEDQFKINICVHELLKSDKVSIFYRSQFNYIEILDLLIIDYSFYKSFLKDHKGFKDNRRHIINNKNATIGNSHCVIFNINFYKKDEKVGAVCPYCTGSFKSIAKMEEHKPDCHASFNRESYIKNRIRKFSENRVSNLRFTKFETLYKLPFITADFETRIDEKTNQHVLFSYGLCFVNIFDLKKSIYKTNFNFNTQKLEIDLLRDLRELVKVYKNMQSVDNHDNKEKNTSKKCRFCLKKYSEIEVGDKEKSVVEYNHTHFEGDEINKHLDGFCCLHCNRKMTIKNKPISCFFHNGKGFDFSFLLNAIFKDENIKDKNIKLLSKSASKFTSITVNFNEGSIEFKDSLLQIPGSLDKLTQSWLKLESDFDLLKILQKKIYKKKNVDKLYQLSKVKAPFGYSLLNKESNLCRTEFEMKEYFNVLTNSDISETDYEKTKLVYKEFSRDQASRYA